MVLVGAIVNGVAVVIGGVLGLIFTNIPEKIKETMMNVLGISVLLLGAQMGMKSENFLVVLVSLVLGGIVGELLKIELGLEKLGMWMQQKQKRQKGSFAEGFVTATLIFAIGAMGILGALDSGLRLDHKLLYTKSVLDGVTAIVLSSTLGIGVLFSAVPVILYEEIIAVSAGLIENAVPRGILDSFILEMTAVGGVMIMGIGFNVLGLIKVRVANLLPAIPIVFIMVWGMAQLG